jgi:hypothetical protein
VKLTVAEDRDVSPVAVIVCGPVAPAFAFEGMRPWHLKLPDGEARRRCCVVVRGRVDARTVVFSDDASEFSERRPDALVGAHVHSELVVASAQVLHEGVPGDNYPSAALAFETPHWP